MVPAPSNLFLDRGKLLAHGGGGIAHFLDRAGQLVFRYTKMSDPVLKLILLVEHDLAAVARDCFDDHHVMAFDVSAVVERKRVPAWLRAKRSGYARNHRPGLRYQMQQRGALERAAHPAEEPTDAERHHGAGIGLGLDPFAKPSIEIACGLPRNIGALAVQILRRPRGLVQHAFNS
jgi:hypothetical protein